MAGEAVGMALDQPTSTLIGGILTAVVSTAVGIAALVFAWRNTQATLGQARAMSLDKRLWKQQQAAYEELAQWVAANPVAGSEDPLYVPPPFSAWTSDPGQEIAGKARLFAVEPVVTALDRLRVIAYEEGKTAEAATLVLEHLNRGGRFEETSISQALGWTSPNDPQRRLDKLRQDWTSARNDLEQAVRNVYLRQAPFAPSPVTAGAPVSTAGLNPERRMAQEGSPTPDPHPIDGGKELEALDSAATWLVGSFTTLAAGLAAFGAVSGGLTRMLRNYPWQSLAAAILTSAAIGFGILAKTVTKPERILGRLRDPTRLRRWLVRWGVVLFIIGLALAVGTATQAPRGRERPEITASLNYENGLTLIGEVKASDLRWDDFMEVSVLAAKLATDRPNVIRWNAQKFLHISHTGPDADGNVNLALHVPIRPEQNWDLVQVTANIGSMRPGQRPGFPDCHLEAPGTLGCMFLRLPVVHRPQVFATWSATGGRPALTVTTKAQAQPSMSLIRTTVLARSSKKTSLLSKVVVNADGKGDVAHTQVVPVGGSNSIVCVISERLSDQPPKLKLPTSRGRCPANNATRVVVTLAVPSANRSSPIGT